MKYILDFESRRSRSRSQQVRYLSELLLRAATCTATLGRRSVI